ncbi:MAG: PAS domain S-box protein [Proteobacteria bacterium]|nr:PAS domain S-box protein [Pseudomonadota bacterium]
MNEKPTYKELEKKLIKLEKEITRRKDVEKELKISLKERSRSEAALRESEERFRCISTSAQDAIVMMDGKGNIAYWNEAAERIFGYTKSEMIGNSLHKTLVPQKHIKTFTQGFKTFKKTGLGAVIGKTREFSGLRKNGTEFPIELSLSSVMLQGEWCAVGILRDISDRKRAEEQLRKAHTELERRVRERTTELMIANEKLRREIEERKQLVRALQASKERFDLAVYGSKDGLYDWDITTDRIYYSPRLKELLGYDENAEPPEAVDAWASSLHPKDYQRVMEALKGHLEHGKPYDVEFLYRNINGEYRWQHSRGRAIFNREGKAVRMVGFISDITERKQGEEALRRSEEKYRLLVKNLPSIVYRGFKDWSVEFVDEEKIELLTGYNREAFNSRRIKWSDLIIKKDFESARQSFLWALKTNKSYVREYRIKTRAGQIHWIQDRGQIICDENGEVVYVSGVFFDINEHKRTEEALLKSEKELRFLSSQLLSAEETVRKRIARELHDGIGQALSAIKFSVENAIEERRKESPTLGIESLPSVIPLIQQTIEEVRRIVRELRPSILDDLGILATITWFCRDFQNIYSAVHIEKEIFVKENEIAVSLKTIIYRILQEAMNNVTKHSQADQVRLCLKKTGKNIELLIEDNGQGFDVEEVILEKNSMRGFGLATMRERAELSEGTFTIESAKGTGTTIRVLWPV